jgi:hypothetical protein
VPTMEVRFIFKSTKSKSSSSGKAISHVKRLPVLVGRSDAPEIKLHIRNDSVSRRHCEFLLDEQGQVSLRDLESTNGTTLDGKPLKPRVAVPVASGSRVKLGEIGFRVEYALPGEAAASHDSDTIPINEAAAADQPMPPPATSPPVLEPGEPTGPPADEEAAPGELVLPAAAAGEADVAPTEGFAFLEAEAPPATEPPAWPEPGEESSAGGGSDANLDDFLKGLS